jgi:hypothetical protein
VAAILLSTGSARRSIPACEKAHRAVGLGAERGSAMAQDAERVPALLVCDTKPGPRDNAYACPVGKGAPADSHRAEVAGSGAGCFEVIASREE